MSYYTYLVQCSDNSYYCGYCIDLEQRVYEHNYTDKGAKYTRGRRPVELKYYEEYSTKSQALKREYSMKQLTHKQKKELVYSFNKS